MARGHLATRDSVWDEPSERSPIAPRDLPMTVKLREVGEGDRPIFFDRRLEPVATRRAAVLSRDGGRSRRTGKGSCGQDGRCADHPPQRAGSGPCRQLRAVRRARDRLLARSGTLGTGPRHPGAGGLPGRVRGAAAPHVAKLNLASRRMLVKCGLRVVGEATTFSRVGGARIDGLVFRLEERV